MAKFDDVINNQTPWNEERVDAIHTELKNVIVSGGQTISDSDLFQVSKSLSNYSCYGDFYADSGTTTSRIITLAPIDNRQPLTSYTNGLQVRFIANQSYVPTNVNINSLGNKAVSNYIQLIAGQLYEAFYDGTNFTISQINTNFSNDNLIINGNFDIWQRGSSFTTNPSSSILVENYTADRWAVITSVNGPGVTTTRQPFPAGVDTPSGAQYYLRLSQNADGSGGSGIFQRMEDIRRFSDKIITFSGRIRSSVNKTLSIRAFQQFSNGANASASVPLTFQNINTTPSWQYFTATFDSPSIQDKTLNSGSHLVFQIFNPNDGAVNIDISEFKVEFGGNATPFINRHIQQEIALCQRYFTKTFPIDTAPANGAGLENALSTRLTNVSNNNVGVLWEFPVEMRVVPSIQGFNPNATPEGFYFFTNDNNSSIPAGLEANAGRKRVGIQHTATSGSAFRDYYIHATADAEL